MIIVGRDPAGTYSLSASVFPRGAPHQTARGNDLIPSLCFQSDHGLQA